MYDAMVQLALAEYPLECCGLAAGPTADDADVFTPCRNDAASARVYSLHPQDFMRAELAADDTDRQINVVVHSHTHSAAWPSPTDVAAAVSPEWHYVIVSLQHEAADVRSFRIVEGDIVAEPVEVVEALG